MMKAGVLAVLVLLMIAAPLRAPAIAAGQESVAAKADNTRSTARKWTPPRTAEGQPDLQGIWTNATLTPLERPADLAHQEFLTPQEAEEYQRQVLARWDRDNRGGGAQADLGRAYGSVWWDADARLVPVTRTSLLVDPA